MKPCTARCLTRALLPSFPLLQEEAFVGPSLWSSVVWYRAALTGSSSVKVLRVCSRNKNLENRSGSKRESCFSWSCRNLLAKTTAVLVAPFGLCLGPTRLQVYTHASVAVFTTPGLFFRVFKDLPVWGIFPHQCVEPHFTLSTSSVRCRHLLGATSWWVQGWFPWRGARGLARLCPCFCGAVGLLRVPFPVTQILRM